MIGSHFNAFLKTNIEKKSREYLTRDDSFWKKKGEEMALEVFHQASERIPAYKDFLKKHTVDASNIKTYADFQTVPLTDKPSYINAYKLNELCWDGKIETSYLMSSSSGSTGIPNFWPRSDEQTAQGALISELIYRDIFESDKQSTLYIVAFAMGMWIAGTYMMTATEWVAQKGYPITIATPGLNRDEILRLVEVGHKYYDQTIIIGYPPFVKDVVDLGIERAVPWKKMNVKFMFSGEAFTERWRQNLMSKVGLKDYFKSTINIYGSADVGLVAHETPYTVFLRKTAYENKTILNELFGAERIPSVNQYDPRLRFFEQVENQLVITSRSGIPLIRYNTMDIGNILYFEDVKSRLAEHSIDIEKEFTKARNGTLLWKTPIVYLFGRGKFTATIYGVNIFPEYVKFVLDSKELEKQTTGKYIISTEETKSNDQELLLRVELSEKIKPSAQLTKLVRNVFVSEVTSVSSEYSYLTSTMGRRVHPKVILHTYGDPDYFPRGVIKKNA